MAASEELTHAWRILEQESWTQPGLYERRLAASGPHYISAVLVRPDGIVGLALDLPANLGGHIKEDGARGFVLNKAWNESTGSMRVSLTLSDRRYLDVFEVLACDVLERVIRAASIENGCIALRDRIAHWKKFLKVAGYDGLPPEAQTGLFGELFVMRKLLGTGACAPERILSAWHGPSGANQDYSSMNRAIEVKTTTANDAARLSIANELQLDEGNLQDLFLFQLALDRKDGAGETLPQLVLYLIAALGESLHDEFVDRLILAGYHKMHEHKYDGRGYFFRFSRVYRVAGLFPRIKQGELRSGVSDVRYTVDVSNIASAAHDIGDFAVEIFSGQE